MKILTILIIIISATFAIACPNISGKFQGICQETFSGQPELNKNPEIIFEINQTSCEQISVEMIAVSSGAKIKDDFDLTVEKKEMIDGEKAKVYSSGSYDNDSFIGIIDYVSKHSGQSVFKFKTIYTKINKSGVTFLSAQQSAVGYGLSCEIPAVN